MKIIIIYPSWPKLNRQTEFHLPPNGPVCFAAAIPADIEISFYDENVEAIDFNKKADLIAMSVMLTCQMPRAWEIADIYRERGIPVIFGGIATMLHHEEVLEHADSVFLGEAEGRFSEVINDFLTTGLKRIYNYMNDFPAMDLIGPARRSILNRGLYNYRGVPMVDLVHASRGCRFDCFPCCTGFLGGRKFRRRSRESVIEEISLIDNNRLYVVEMFAESVSVYKIVGDAE